MGTCIKTPVVIGEENTQILLLSETIIFNVPINRIVGEHFEVQITHSKAVEDKVLFKGFVKKDILYKEPPDKFNEGYIRYHEERYDFAGIVEVAGAQPGDKCRIESAGVEDNKLFIPETIDNNGNILSASEEFIIELQIKVTRESEVTIENGHEQ